MPPGGPPISFGPHTPNPARIHDYLLSGHDNYDDDPQAARRAQRILHPVDGGVAFIEADIRHPAAVLADPDLAKVIDLDQPVMILLTLVLQFMPAEEGRDVVAGYAEQLASGSLIAVSVPRNDDPASFARVGEAWPGEVHNHTRAETASFLDGLEPVPPGLVLARGAGAAGCRHAGPPQALPRHRGSPGAFTMVAPLVPPARGRQPAPRRRRRGRHPRTGSGTAPRRREAPGPRHARQQPLSPGRGPGTGLAG